MSCLSLSGSVQLQTGWGQHLFQIAQRMRNEVWVRPIHYGGPEVPLWLQLITTYEIPPCPNELILFTAGTPRTPGKRSAYFTMHETDTLPDKWVKNLNGSDLVVVPCQWNKDNFRRCGVKTTIRVVPLGYDSPSRTPMKMDGPTVFGCAGNPNHGALRKGVPQVILAFLMAFPHEENVRLRVKVLEEGEWEIPHDPRIVVDQGFYTDEELSQWYGNLTCFVSAARGEGWGLMQHQAMSSSRPVIASIYGGLKEFMTKENSYACDYDEVPVEGYVGGGKWCRPRMEHMIDLMRYVHQSRDEARRRGQEAARGVQELTWTNSCEKLFKTLKDFGM